MSVSDDVGVDVDVESPHQDLEISMVTEVIDDSSLRATSLTQPSISTNKGAIEGTETSDKDKLELQSSVDQGESEQPVDVILEVVEDSEALDESMPLSETPKDSPDLMLSKSGVEEKMADEEDDVMGTTEYAISQVIGGDITHTSGESTGTLTSTKVQSASVTLFDPAQKDSIIQYADQSSISQASRRFKVPATTIKKWMNSQEDSAGLTKSKFNSPGQGRKLSYSQDTDDRIASHIQELLTRGDKVTLQYICNYAKSLIKEENPSFIASSGWAQRFLVRHAIELNVQRPIKKKTSSSPESLRGRPLSYSQTTDKAIADYVKGMLADGVQVTNSELRKYAKDMICKENPSFTGSASWAQNFLLRHKIALQSFPSSNSYPQNSPSSGLSQSMLSSTSTSSSPPPISDPPLIPAEIAPTSGSSGPIYSDASMGSMENVAEDPMKTALTLLTGENVDLTVLSNTQVAALQNSLSELTADAVSLVDILSTSTSGNSTSHQRQSETADAEGEDQGDGLIVSGLESPTSGNVYLNLGGGEGFSSGVIGLGTSQSTSTTQKPPTSTATPTSSGYTCEVVAQGSRPLSYAVETDQHLANWVEAQQANGKRVTFAQLRSYAKQLISSENPNFNASVGWVTPFLLRHNLDLSVNRKIRSTRKNVPHRVSALHEKLSDSSRLNKSEDSREDGQLASSSSQVESLAQQKGPSTPGNSAITPDMLASIATTFAEAVLAQQQQQQNQQESDSQEREQQPSSMESQKQQTELTDRSVTTPSMEVGTSSMQGLLQNSILEQTSSSSSSSSIMAGPVPVNRSVMVADPLAGADHGDHGDNDKISKKPSRNEKSRTRHTLAEKLEVVQLMKEHGVAAHYVCRMLGIANSTFAGWTKLVQQKGAELQALSANKKRANVSGQGRPLSYPRDKDDLIARWVKEQQQLGISVSPSDLSKHATFIISQENPNFTASSGWQQKFLQRHNIQLSTSWIQKPSSHGNMQGENRLAALASMPSPILRDSESIPAAVQTEEVSSNDYGTLQSPAPKSYSYSDELDEELVQWVREKQANQEPLTVQMLCKKAEDVISKEVLSFVATLGWAFKFLHRHSIMLDPKSSNSSSAGLLESSRKRRISSNGIESTDASSKYLHTPKKVRQMDHPSPVVGSSPPVPTSTATTTPDLSVSPNAGNFCEALLALSNQAMADGEPALQAAMQNLQNAVQHALKQQQLHLQQQQQQQQQQETEGQRKQFQGEQHVTEELVQGHQASVSVPLTIIPCSVPSSFASSRKPLKLSSGDLPPPLPPPTERVTPYNNYFGKPAREFTPEEKEEVVRYANATTLLKAALKYGVAAPTVWRWRVELKLHQPKYTAMQKKYIIKFAETNSLKEAAHRYGITSKTIQNWRKALQSDGDSTSLSAPSSDEVLPIVNHTTDQMLETSPALSKVATSHDSEVVAYDSHNFQFIVDGGEVTDISSRGDHDLGDPAPTTPIRVDPVPLEVTNEVDIENVGMEYDVISSEGHAAKPRCTAEEKVQILQYAIEHSVREASQKYGISPGTLYYWKKTNLAGTGGSPSTGNSTTLPGGVAVSSCEEAGMVMSVYPSTSSLLEHIQVGSSSSIGATQQERDSVKVGGEQYFSSASDVVSTSLSGSEVSLLHAVSSFLNPADSSIVTSSGHSDLSQPVIAHSTSIGGGISSPTEVLVAPLQVASEEVATIEVEESDVLASASSCSASPHMDQEVESVVVVDVDSKGQEGILPMEISNAVVEVKSAHDLEVEHEQGVQADIEEIRQEVGPEVQPGSEEEVEPCSVSEVEPEVQLGNVESEQKLQLEIGQEVEPEVSSVIE